MTHSIQSSASRSMTPNQMRNRLALPGEVSKLLAEFVCSAYWDKNKTVSTQQLERFGNENFDLVSQVLSYGQSQEDDAELHALACWCRIEHQLSDWAGI